MRLYLHMCWVDIDLCSVRTQRSDGVEVEQGPTLSDAAAAGLWPLHISILNNNHELHQSMQELSIDVSSSSVPCFIPVSDLEELRVGCFSGGTSLRGLLEARARESRMNGKCNCPELSSQFRTHVHAALLSYGCGKMHFEVMLGSGEGLWRAHCPVCSVYEIQTPNGKKVLMGGAAATCMDASSCVKMRQAPKAGTSKCAFQRAIDLVHHPWLDSILIDPPRVHELLVHHDQLANKHPAADGVAVGAKGTDLPPAPDTSHCEDVKFNCRQEEVGSMGEWEPGACTTGVFFCMCEHGIICKDGALAMTWHETFGHTHTAQGSAMNHRTFGLCRFRAASYPKKDEYGNNIPNPTYRVMYDLACSYRKNTPIT